MHKFITNLLHNDLSSYIQLVELIEFLAACDLDLKQLAVLRIPFGQTVTTIPYDRYRSDLTLIL